jgi:hypothetical protein
MLYQCILTGNLAGDPEVIYSSARNQVASLSLALHSSLSNYPFMMEPKPSCQYQILSAAAPFSAGSQSFYEPFASYTGCRR